MAFDAQRYCITQAASIRDASACIDGNRAKIALVVDEMGRLVDTVTDGDIRRAILAGLELSAPVPQLHAGKLHRTRAPVTAALGTDRSTLLQLMREQRVRQVPLVDVGGRVVDLVTQSDLEQSGALPVHAVIMAGGYGVRLRPLTNDVPKPMLPVGDRPLLEVIVERLRHAGVRRISILTHYMSDTIMGHFGDGGDFGVEIDYVREDEPLGTAGALTLLKASDDPLLVLNGDILTRTDYAALLDFHREHHAEITVGVREYDFRVPYGVVDVDGVQVTAITEKPVVKYFVNAGIYLLGPDVCRHLPHNQRCDMPTLINARVSAGANVVTFPVHEYWLDIGQIDDYRKADADLRDGTA
jgi:dTDP-glucose pyrophosphorylase/CBS domain-containing protein